MTEAGVRAYLKKKRLAVLLGGWSRERPVSLQTGAAVLTSFKRLAIPAAAVDVKPDIDRVLAKRKFQFCFIALHGTFGEDGGIQSFLEVLKIPYTGSGPLASARAMDKDLSKKVFRRHRVPTPPWLVIAKDDFDAAPEASLRRAGALLREGPLFIKPIDQGSAIGASKVDRARQLPRALHECFQCSDGALVERFIKGRELTVSILGKRALPVMEIIPEHRFYDYHSIYAQGGSRHITPAKIPAQVAAEAQTISQRAFHALGCSVYGRVDLMLPPSGRLEVLEVNTIPGMTSTSLLPEAARAVGIDFDTLVLKIVGLSINDRHSRMSLSGIHTRSKAGFPLSRE